MIARTLPFGNGAVTQTRLALPSHWALWLINNDTSYLDTLSAQERVALHNTQIFGTCVDVDNDEGFMWNHDASADLPVGAMCSTFTFVEMH